MAVGSNRLIKFISFVRVSIHRDFAEPPAIERPLSRYWNAMTIVKSLAERIEHNYRMFSAPTSFHQLLNQPNLNANGEMMDNSDWISLM